MDLVCYLHPGWEPLLRPAEATRDWMDKTNEKFAYRCLPLNIANAHGWEFLNANDFQVHWNGGQDAKDITIRPAPGSKPEHLPVSIFGHGVLTFHIFGVIRTPPGWNLFVGGSPNTGRDGIVPLNGVIETDWSPYTFTMNYRFLRRNVWLTFKQGEPICFFFPVQRGIMESFRPRFAPMEGELLAQFKAWSASRDAFREETARNPPATASEQWQKRYYRGIDMHDEEPVADHKARLRLPDFAPIGTPPATEPEALQINGSAASIGGTLRRLAEGLARGADVTDLVAEMMTLGLAQSDAEAVVRAAMTT